jgi:hypothetical protein
MKQELQKYLEINNPGLKDYQIINCVNSYVTAVMQQIAVQFAIITSEDIAAGEFSFAVDTASKQAGQATLNGKRIRVYTMMQEQPNTSLVIERYKGNSYSGRISKVTFNPKYKKLIYKELMANDYLTNDIYLDNLAVKANFKIPIDMSALDSYIKNTQQMLERAKNQNHIDTLSRNFLAAKQIKQHATAKSDGTYYVKEFWDEIDSGRAHGHGLSLQRVSKVVRHAALGRCTKIDFKASSYAILTSVALAINPNLKVEALKAYIKYRTTVRNRIAKKIGISEDWMKTIFTAMGFGAELKDNTYNSIRKKIGKEKYNVLVVNQEFAYIKQALDDVRKTILTCDKFKGDAFSIGSYTYSSIDPKTQKKRSKNQKLAWIYQALERFALDFVLSKVPDQYDVLLPVHDCLYIKQTLPSQVMLDLKSDLKEIFELLDFEQEIVIPIHAPEDHNKVEESIAAEVAEHRKRVEQEERAAKGYVSKNIEMNVPFRAKPDYSNESNADYELRRKREFLLDIQMHKFEDD